MKNVDAVAQLVHRKKAEIAADLMRYRFLRTVIVKEAHMPAPFSTWSPSSSGYCGARGSSAMLSGVTSGEGVVGIIVEKLSFSAFESVAR
ncbi:hypothetical protein D3C80_1954140 [compost metagenome]